MSQTVGAGEKIFVGLDGSANATAALAWAIDEARARSASVEAVYVWHEPTMAYDAAGYVPLTNTEVEKQAQELLASALAGIAPIEDVKVSLRAASGNPSEVLAWAAGDVDISLVVVGARGHGGLVGLVLGSVSHALTRRCPKPIVIVPSGWRPAEVKDASRKIVVGVDGSPESERALAWAIHEGVARHAPVEAVMVWRNPSPVLPAHSPLSELAVSGADAKLNDILRRVVGREATADDHVETLVLSGRPAQRLVEEAREGQLLVLGSRGLGRARETVSGSVSHACTHHAPVSVVVIPRKTTSPPS
jgi:nucleotide-binding universal stress UspA family protein